MCINVLPVCMFVYHSCAWIPQGQNRSPGTRVTDSYELPCGCWELKLSPLNQCSQPLGHLSNPTERCQTLLQQRACGT